MLVCVLCCHNIYERNKIDALDDQVKVISRISDVGLMRTCFFAFIGAASVESLSE